MYLPDNVFVYIIYKYIYAVHSADRSTPPHPFRHRLSPPATKILYASFYLRSRSIIITYTYNNIYVYCTYIYIGTCMCTPASTLFRQSFPGAYRRWKSSQFIRLTAILFLDVYRRSKSGERAEYIIRAHSCRLVFIVEFFRFLSEISDIRSVHTLTIYTHIYIKMSACMCIFLLFIYIYNIILRLIYYTCIQGVSRRTCNPRHSFFPSFDTFTFFLNILFL